MDYRTNPERTYLNYYLKKWGLSFLVLPALLFKNLVIPEEVRLSFNAPAKSEFTRADDPSVRVLLRTNMPNSNGMNQARRDTLDDVLNLLPASHVSTVDMIGVVPVPAMSSSGSGAGGTRGRANEAGIIVLNDNFGPAYFQHDLLHEVGHMVEFHGIGDARQEWEAIHQRFPARENFVNEFNETIENYIRNDEREDFAATYAIFASRTSDLALEAVGRVKEGATGLLEKYLFMAGVFTDADGNVNTYNLSPEALQVQIPMALPEFIPLNLARIPHYRTADTLTLGAYTFRLSGNMITAIESRSGAVIVDNLLIPVPQIIFDRWSLTAPAPALDNPAALAADCQNRLACTDYPSTVETPEKSPIDPGPLSITSPRPPTEYVPLMSQAGYTSVAGEQAIASPRHRITLADQLRPHGDFQVSPAVPLP